MAPTANQAAEELFARIKTEIFDFRLLPGDRFTETEIALRYGVSRTPVRSALYRLKHEGFWVRGVDLKYPEFSETTADDFILGDLRVRLADQPPESTRCSETSGSLGGNPPLTPTLFLAGRGATALVRARVGDDVIEARPPLKEPLLDPELVEHLLHRVVHDVVDRFR